MSERLLEVLKNAYDRLYSNIQNQIIRFLGVQASILFAEGRRINISIEQDENSIEDYFNIVTDFIASASEGQPLDAVNIGQYHVSGQEDFELIDANEGVIFIKLGFILPMSTEIDFFSLYEDFGEDQDERDRDTSDTEIDYREDSDTEQDFREESDTDIDYREQSDTDVDYREHSDTDVDLREDSDTEGYNEEYQRRLQATRERDELLEERERVQDRIDELNDLLRDLQHTKIKRQSKDYIALVNQTQHKIRFTRRRLQQIERNLRNLRNQTL